MSNGRSPNQEWLDMERNRDREAGIWERHLKGQTQLSISLEYGISPSRVGQILKRLKREAEVDA